MAQIKQISIAAFAPLVILSLYCYSSNTCSALVYTTVQVQLNVLASHFLNFLPKILSIFLVLVITKTLNLFLQKTLSRFEILSGASAKHSLGKSIAKYSLWIISLLIILSILFENITVLFTSLGLIGFGITFALQKPILNFVGWITILSNHTYTIGDRIRVGDVRGDVVDIKLMYTTLDGLLPNRDEPSGKIITVPNELVLTSPIVNFTRSGNYLWDELQLTVTFESNWSKGAKMLEKAAASVVKKYINNKGQAIHSANILRSFRLLNLFDHRQIKKTGKLQSAKTERDKRLIDEHIDTVPIVRILLRDSAVELNVRYLAHYRSLIAIKSEINSLFLNMSKGSKDVEIAYPHLQLVTKGKTSAQQEL